MTIRKELIEKLEALWSQATQGPVSQYVGREHPKRIDLVVGEDVQSLCQKLEETKEKITGLINEKAHLEQQIKNLLHFHPVEGNVRNLTENAENNMNFIEAVWNAFPEILTSLQEEKKEI